MPASQNPYTQIARHTQEATLAIVRAWTRFLHETVTRVPVLATQAAAKAAAQQIIDQASGFATTMIDVQHTLSKQIVTSSANVAEGFVQQATSAMTQAGAQAIGTAAKAGRTRKTNP